MIQRAVRPTTNVLSAAPEVDVVVLNKHRFSGFFETELDDFLRQRKIRSLIVVRATTRWAQPACFFSP